MIIEFQILDTEDFLIEHLDDKQETKEQIAQFSALNDASGLEYYLKNQALQDEKSFSARTYLIKDKITKELAAYFSLRNGLITVQAYHESFDTIPAIELSNFAVNQNYRKNHPEIEKLGSYILNKFVLPIARTMQKYVGITSLYIYALPDEKLIEHYKTMGFTRLSKKQEKFVQNHIKPKYDEGCVFMFMTL